MKKIDFPYNNFPKKDISLRKCTPKNIFSPSAKKKSKNFFAPAARYRWDPPPQCYIISVFCASALLPLYLSLLRRQMRLQMIKKNMSKMAPKWPQNGPCGPFRAAKGHFGSFWGNFGAQVLTKLTNVPYNAQIEAFTASFCACWLDFRQFLVVWVFWGSSEALLEAFCGLQSPFWTFWRPFGPILSPFGTFWRVIWAYPCGKVPPTRRCCPCLGPYGPCLGLCGW